MRKYQRYLKEYSGKIPHMLVTLNKYLDMFFWSSHNPITDLIGSELLNSYHLLV